MLHPSDVLTRGARETFRMGRKRYRRAVRVQGAGRPTLRTLHFGHPGASDLVWLERNRAGKGTPGRWPRRRCVPDGIAPGRPFTDAPGRGRGRPYRRARWLGGLRRARGGHGAGAREGRRTHPEQTPETVAATFSVLELVFRRVRIHRHALTLRIRERMRLETRQRERWEMGMQRTGDGAHQPVFQHPHTANAPLVEIIPVVHEVLGI